MEVRPGRYMHFKGGIYEVLGVAKHTETLEEYVVYTDGKCMWARPLSMFLEAVDLDGRKVPRFRALD